MTFFEYISIRFFLLIWLLEVCLLPAVFDFQSCFVFSNVFTAAVFAHKEQFFVGFDSFVEIGLKFERKKLTFRRKIDSKPVESRK